MGKPICLLIGTITAIVLMASQNIFAVPIFSEFLDGTWFSWASLNDGLDPSSKGVIGQLSATQGDGLGSVIGKIILTTIAVIAGLIAFASFLISRALRTLMDG